MSDLTYYQRIRDVILNRAKDYYENDKERLKVHAKKEKTKRENMEKADTTIKTDTKTSKKLSQGKKVSI